MSFNEIALFLNWLGDVFFAGFVLTGLYMIGWILDKHVFR